MHDSLHLLPVDRLTQLLVPQQARAIIAELLRRPSRAARPAHHDTGDGPAKRGVATRSDRPVQPPRYGCPGRLDTGEELHPGRASDL